MSNRVLQLLLVWIGLSMGPSVEVTRRFDPRCPDFVLARSAVRPVGMKFSAPNSNLISLKHSRLTLVFSFYTELTYNQYHTWRGAPIQEKLDPSVSAFWRQIISFIHNFRRGAAKRPHHHTLHRFLLPQTIQPSPCPCMFWNATARKSRSTLTRLPAASPSFVMVLINRCVALRKHNMTNNKPMLTNDP